MNSSERVGGWNAKRRTGPAADAAASSPPRSTSAGTSSRAKSPCSLDDVDPARPSSQTRRRRRPRPRGGGGPTPRAARRSRRGGDPAAGDDHDVLADVLDQVELVAGEDDPDAGRRPLAEDLGHRRDAERVEPAERLVEDEQLRVVDERRAELDALLVAVRQRLELGPLRSRQAQPGEPARGRRGRVAGRHPVVLGEVAELLGDVHPRVEAALLRHVAEAEACHPVDRLAAPERSSPLSGLARPKMQRIVVVLPAPFGPRKPTSRPGRAMKRRAVEGDDVAVALREVLDLKHRGGQSSGWVRSDSTGDPAGVPVGPSARRRRADRTARARRPPRPGDRRSAAIRRARWRLGEYSPRSM